MCGISGIVDGNIGPMIMVQEHRGPDGSGSWRSNRVQLGHNRLAVLDLTDAGAQPMYTSRYVLTYNGEIYNYKDLQRSLDPEDRHGNDAKTLLAYIEKFGLHAALRDINGMYAFGLYDIQKDELHLVTDRFCQKPLYFTLVDGKFAFASSPAALLHLQEKWSISEEALRSYWALGSVMVDSIFSGIYKLPAASWAIYDLQTKMVHHSRYWEPKYQPDTSLIEYYINDSIDKVKEADVPVYIFLSGGVDSSLVASRCGGMNAIHMEGPERSYAMQAAKAFDIKLRVVDPAACDARDAIEDYSAKCGEPSMAGIIPWITSREAARFCKVAISANGADELFFGYDRTSQDITADQMAHIFRRKYYEHTVPEIDPRLSSGRWLELMSYVQCDLNKTLDFAAMAHSLEVRSPFLDHRLVEMALSIPQEEHGRKEILKRMLRRRGFSNEYLNRPKMGFSLYKEPRNFSVLKKKALQWCVSNGYLKLYPSASRRDQMYLETSALGFQCWWNVWNHKLKN